MPRRTVEMTDTLYEYCRRVSVREPSILARLREETSRLENAGMQIAPQQGQFMQLLARLMGARDIIEIGTYTGYSALWMALALPDDGRLVCCDISEAWTRIARRYWEEAGLSGVIRLHLAPAEQTLTRLLESGEAGQFDMAFIDADKTGYRTYYELCLELLRPGGLILFDNMLWGGSVADPDDRSEDTEAIRAMNELLHEDTRVDVSLLPVEDGVTLALKL